MAKPFHDCTGCMFPVGELFCDAPVGRGKVYCERHEAASRSDTKAPSRFTQYGFESKVKRDDADRVVPVDEFMRGVR